MSRVTAQYGDKIMKMIAHYVHKIDRITTQSTVVKLELKRKSYGLRSATEGFRGQIQVSQVPKCT